MRRPSNLNGEHDSHSTPLHAGHWRRGGQPHEYQLAGTCVKCIMGFAEQPPSWWRARTWRPIFNSWQWRQWCFGGAMGPFFTNAACASVQSESTTPGHLHLHLGPCSF